jgi:hypothetical protein
MGQRVTPYLVHDQWAVPKALARVAAANDHDMLTEAVRRFAGSRPGLDTSSEQVVSTRNVETPPPDTGCADVRVGADGAPVFQRGGDAVVVEGRENAKAQQQQLSAGLRRLLPATFGEHRSRWAVGKTEVVLDEVAGSGTAAKTTSVSQAIAATVDQGLIKLDPRFGSFKRHAAYVPFFS